VRNLDLKLIAAVALVWGVFALAYWSLGMLDSAATWGAGACIFLLFAVAMSLAQRRSPQAAPTTRRKEWRGLDIFLIATVAVVWGIFALVYGALGMTVNAATWWVGAWLFVALAAGLVIADRRGRRR
jgi:hypothetical protein